MKRQSVLVLGYFILVLIYCGCDKFNTCQQELGPLKALNDIDFDLRHSKLRTREMPIGNLVADSARHAAGDIVCANDSQNGCINAAVVNAGAIRQETKCHIRDKLAKGNIYESDLSNLLPKSDPLVAVRLRGFDIHLMLERAVSGLRNRDAFHEAPYFLQVAGIQFEVDCSKPPQRISIDNSRILEKGSRVSNIILTDNNDPIVENEHYIVAMPKYLADGHDGFISTLIREKDDVNVHKTSNLHSMPIYNPSRDILTIANKPLTLKEAVTYRINIKLSKKMPGIEIEMPEQKRIILHNNCFAPSEYDDTSQYLYQD